MKAVYPSKTFLTQTRDAFVKRQDHVMLITSPWRRKLVAREIQGWAKSLRQANEIATGRSKGFPLCMMLMPSLMSMHHFAIAHGYVMSFHFADDQIEIRYEFKGQDVPLAQERKPTATP
ncbi:hypothetical protein [Ramlibacter humi]|uniref:Uncharacterized protein n=1 Tax=Ramlibacter humi TaxID=2530451 RepID=A0A4Z0BCR5_9BURK|nr:hypothetical protein [Ramlibacter humi]TFY96149.1 hypothetical protein EZ216_21140 [Ramlibacter humi]